MVEKKEVDLTSLAENWPSSHVARCSIGDFTGGGMTPKRMANLDSLGEGPSGAIRCGRKVLYPVKNLVTWLENRCQLISSKKISINTHQSQNHSTFRQAHQKLPPEDSDDHVKGKVNADQTRHV